MSAAADFLHGASWLEATRAEFEGVLVAKLDDLVGPSPELNEAVRYGLLDGGKRLRALLVYAAGHAVGTMPEHLHDAACAIEAVHAYSLVHDDLPCMDNDVLRRGKPTCHVKFGEAMALLAGDALQTTAFHWLAHSRSGSAEARLAQLATLSTASGVMGMAAGQAIDMGHVGKSMGLGALQEMHARKTGDLIVAAVRLGYQSKPALGRVHQQGLEAFANALGLAYQVIDDILDVESSSETLGKTSGKDAVNNKPTVVSLLGLEEAKRMLAGLRADAMAASANFAPAQRAPLETLVELITNRKS